MIGKGTPKPAINEDAPLSIIASTPFSSWSGTGDNRSIPKGLSVSSLPFFVKESQSYYIPFWNGGLDIFSFKNRYPKIARKIAWVCIIKLAFATVVLYMAKT